MQERICAGYATTSPGRFSEFYGAVGLCVGRVAERAAGESVKPAGYGGEASRARKSPC